MIFIAILLFPQDVLGFRAMVVSREETAIFFLRSSRTTTSTQLNTVILGKMAQHARLLAFLKAKLKGK